MLVPIEHWNTMSEKTLRFAWSISKEIRLVHVVCDEEGEDFRPRWEKFIELPSKKAQLPVPDLVVLRSPFRFVVYPIVDYALKEQAENPDRHLAILVPELIENHWYNYLLHNNRSRLLQGLLTLKQNPRITVTNIPWFLDPSRET